MMDIFLNYIQYMFRFYDKVHMKGNYSFIWGILCQMISG